MIFYGLLVFLVLLLLLLAIDYILRYTRFRRLLNQIPSPPPLPIIGHAHLFATDDREYLWDFIRDQIRKYYPIGKVQFPGFTLVICSDPDDCKTLLTDKDNVTKSDVYKYFEAMLPNSLFVVPDKEWNHKRKFVAPAFHPNMLKNFVEVAQEQGELFVKKLSAEGNETVQELLPLLTKLALNIICLSGTGIDPSIMGSDADNFLHAVENCLHIVIYRFCRPYILDWMFKFLSIDKTQNASVATTRAFATKLVQERKKIFKVQSQSLKESKSKVDEDENKIGENCKTTLMLDVLLEAMNEGLISEQDIITEVIATFFAGSDTTGVVLTYILILFAENKEIQIKARLEALDMMNRCQGKMTINDIQSLDYIDRCMKEGLRLYTSGPFILRKLTKDLQLKNYLVPAGVQFVVPIFEIQRDPKYWTNPEKFDPDRWLPENSKNRHPYSFLAFSAGPRNCIGQKFGKLELKVLIVQILSNFYVEPVTKLKDLKFQLHITLSTKTPLYVKFKRIETN